VREEVALPMNLGKAAWLWIAPAERGGDGALDRRPSAVEKSSSCVTRSQNPERRGASLPAALYEAGTLAYVRKVGREARF
jgi:hypothetical protein